MRELSVVIGGYNKSAEAAMAALDLASGYRPFVAAMPEAAGTSIPPLATYEPRISIPVGSWLWGISAKSKETAGFTLQVTDIATRKPLFSQPVSFDNVAGGALTLTNCYGQAIRSAVHLLPKPMPILSPGVLACKIANQANVANIIQVCLHFALAAGTARQNAYGRELATEMSLAVRAIRDAGANSITTTGGDSTGGGVPTLSNGELISVPLDIATVGDNVIIGGNFAGRVTIYQLDLWNVSQQTIEFKDGPTLLRGPLADFPAQAGYGLLRQTDHHFQLTPGRPFIINLSAGTRLTGLVRYRME